MAHDLNSYIKQLERLLSDENADFEALSPSIRVRIGFFQHERTIHLTVTMTFAILVMLSLILTVSQIYFIPLFLLFLGLEIPYVFHYYKLENGVQKLQRLYCELEERDLEKRGGQRTVNS